MIYKNKLLCMWKDLYYLWEAGEPVTTFSDSGTWKPEHPLHECIRCDGYKWSCRGYRSLESIRKTYGEDEEV